MASKRQSDTAEEQQAAGQSKAPAREQDESKPSMTSRVAASASALAKDIIGGSSSTSTSSAGASALTSDLAGSSANGSKSATRSSAPSHAAQESLALLRTETTAQNGSESFREARQISNGDRVKDEFHDFQQYPGTDLRDQYAGMSSFDSRPTHMTAFDQRQAFVDSLDRVEALPKAPNQLTLADAWRESFLASVPATAKGKERAAPLLKVEVLGTDVGIAEMNDGKAVQDLLNDHSFGNAPEELQMQLQDSREPSADDLFSEDSLSVQQMETNAKIRSMLPPPPTHLPQLPEDRGNLRPDVGILDSDYSSVRLDDPTRITAQWLDAWNDVLTRYTDDVWGPDLPLVREAREEIRHAREQVTNDGPVLDSSNSQAVRRLQALLGHLKLPDDPARPKLSSTSQVR